jgi:hypothetical protein
MSIIANVLLFLSMKDRAAIDKLNEDLTRRDSERHQEFRELATEQAGGLKVFCAELWAGAFNHLPPSTIEDCVARAPWRYPESIVLVMDAYDYEQDPRSMTVVELRAHREEEA